MLLTILKLKKETYLSFIGSYFYNSTEFQISPGTLVIQNVVIFLIQYLKRYVNKKGFTFNYNINKDETLKDSIFVILVSIVWFKQTVVANY